MKKLYAYYPASPGSEHFAKEFDKFLTEDFIRPLTRAGFEFEGTTSLTDNISCGGAHILQFEKNTDEELRLDWIKTLTDLDEEGF